MRMFQFAVGALALVVSQAASAANVTELRCESTEKYKDKTQVVRVKMDDGGRIVKWGKGYAKTSSKSLFAIFAEDAEEAGIEWEKAFLAPNGYYIIERGTTADSQTLGVNLKKLKGFYKYEDLGSGSGDLKLELVCEER